MATPTVFVSGLVSQSRLQSDLLNNQVCTDSEIAGYVNDAGSELYDVYTATNQLYTLSHYDFTLSGGIGDTVGVNQIDLASTPGDFQQAHTIWLNPATPQPVRLQMLPNWENALDASPGTLIFSGNLLCRYYAIAGTRLMIFPAVSAAGLYRLWYTPIWTPLSLNTVPASDPSVPATVASFAALNTINFTGAAWTSANVGDTVTTVGATTGSNNGTWTIATVPTANQITITVNSLSTESPTAATATTIPQGTAVTLPPFMAPWSLYLVTHAAITIRNKRDQDVSALTDRLMKLRARIESILQVRNEEGMQPPLTRGGGGWDGFGGGVY